MKPPCDEAVIGTGVVEVPCTAKARSWILAATILGSSMAFIDSTVVNVALPAIQASFHATVVDVQWVVESYGLFLGALILAGGSLGDLFGRRLIFVTGVAIFAAASLACGIAASIHQLIIARSIQGVGAALLVPGSLAIISTSFDEKSRGHAIGTWSGFTAITTAVGPVLGGWLVEHASWRWAFFINLPIAAVVMAISLWRIPESRSTITARIDWAGALLATFALGGLVNGFLESVNLGWSNPLVLGSLIVGFGCLVALVFVEARVTSPMVPLTLFKSRSFSGANLLTLFLYAAIGIFFFLLPLNLIQVQRYSASAAGAAILPLILLMFLLSRWAGGLVAHYGPRGPLTIGPLITAMGFVLFTLPSVGNSYWRSFFPALIVLGFGMTVTVAPLTTVVMNSVDQDRVGTASGINNAVARVAGVLAIAVLGIVMVKAFGSRLNHSLDPLSLPSGMLQKLQSDEIRLAGLQAPAALGPATRSAIQEMIGDAFVFGFRVVMLICAGLSVLSAAVAARMISKRD
ncbi:MAG TPA: MFS transporter [Terriglobales bacterium]|jgi:EmrB/QacA subfamily drug resistance transporter|nr:MFS transporter [Terriglobales bacterium]